MLGAAHGRQKKSFFIEVVKVLLSRFKNPEVFLAIFPNAPYVSSYAASDPYTLTFSSELNTNYPEKQFLKFLVLRTGFEWNVPNVCGTLKLFYKPFLLPKCETIN